MGKTYRLRFSRQADRDLEKIDKSVKDKILRSIMQKLVHQPERFSQPLKYDLKNYRKLRVGAYRVIFTLHNDEILITVVKIGHRRDVYGG